jgi:SAM-dependent methyltransferase
MINWGLVIIEFVKTETIQKLLLINRQFYQTFAADFDATRQRLQPGVARVLDMIPREARILDLGCGNGELARELARRGFAGEYVGIDFSEGLIEAARKHAIRNTQYAIRNTQYAIRDLTAPDWDAGLAGSFDVVFAFAVFHHLPVPFHAEIVRKVRALLRSPHPSTTAGSFPKPKATASAQDADVSLSIPSIPTVPTNSREFPFPKPKATASAQDADNASSPLLPLSSSPFPLFSPPPPPLFILSNWQFLNSPRWTARIQPWERVELTASDLDPHDYLLDWRRGGEGLRYVHHFSVPELTALAEGAGFEVVDTFASDGAEGNLGLYQIWAVSPQSLPRMREEGKEDSSDKPKPKSFGCTSPRDLMGAAMSPTSMAQIFVEHTCM